MIKVIIMITMILKKILMVIRNDIGKKNPS